MSEQSVESDQSPSFPLLAQEHIVVSGGGGFIGMALTQALAAQGAKVSVLGRNRYPILEAQGIVCHQGDIRDRAFVDQALRGKSMVFHVAAKAGIWGPKKEYQSINLQGTRNIISACRNQSVPRLIYTSTPSVVFNQGNIEGGDESLPYATHPLCHYAASKIAAEKEVLAANGAQLRTTALRPHLVWGPGDRHLIPRLLARGRAGKLAIIGAGDNMVDISYIDNVVHAHLLAANNLANHGAAAGQAFFIGQEKPVRLWAWIQNLFAALGLAPIRRRISLRKAYMVGAMLEAVATLARQGHEPPMTRFLALQLGCSHWFNHEKARRLLGYRPLIGTSEGMQRLIDWIKKEKL